MGKDGFTSGDFDPAFPMDDKFLVLAAVTTDRRTYYEATGVYWHVVAASWNAGRRMAVERTVAGASEAAVKALITAGLIDPDGLLPGSSFDRWVGAAQARRAGWAERKRLERASAGVTGSPSDSPRQQPVSQPRPRSMSHETPAESSGVHETPRESAGVTPRAQDRTDDSGQTRRTNGGGLGEPRPKECRQPKEHRSLWVDFAGVGLRCPACADSSPLPAWDAPPPPASKAS